MLLSPEFNRQTILAELKRNNVGVVFHYVPLHSSPAGQGAWRDRAVTDSAAETLIRLPMWMGLTATQQDKMVEVLRKALTSTLFKS